MTRQPFVGVFIASFGYPERFNTRVQEADRSHGTVPPALAHWIALQGHQATHIFDLDFTILTIRQSGVVRRPSISSSSARILFTNGFCVRRRSNWSGFGKTIVQVECCWHGWNRFGPTPLNASTMEKTSLSCGTGNNR
jgi:hypothetical protein